MMQRGSSLPETKANYMEFIGASAFIFHFSLNTNCSLGAQNVAIPGLPGHLGHQFRVSCMQLCKLTVQSLPESHTPPAIDTACYTTKDLGTTFRKKNKTTHYKIMETNTISQHIILVLFLNCIVGILLVVLLLLF